MADATIDQAASSLENTASQEQTQFQQLRLWLGSQVIGQEDLVEKMLINLLASGHMLVEGAPGLAKTRAIKALSDAVEGAFNRIQFTPDLLPSDVTGTDIYRPETASFEFQPGPIFNSLVLADEINRAPAKVQSALLEAMAEGQVSVGRNTYDLPELFMVMATQNPIEQEGTYPLPEAQLDRFLLHVKVDFPSLESERKILKLVRNEAGKSSAKKPAEINQQTIFSARQQVLSLHMNEAVETYLVRIVDATRRPADYDKDLANWLEFGVSPRATIALDAASRASAWLAGKDFVSPADIQAVIHDCLRHRLILSFEAEATGITADQVIDRLLQVVAAN